MYPRIVFLLVALLVGDAVSMPAYAMDGFYCSKKDAANKTDYIGKLHLGGNPQDYALDFVSQLEKFLGINLDPDNTVCNNYSRNISNADSIRDRQLKHPDPGWSSQEVPF